MNTVIKGTKTIAEYKRVREDMENLARGSYSKSEQLPLFLLCGVPFRQGQGKRQEPPLTAFLTHQRRDTR